MYYKHLKDFLEQANQKLFWIVTYGNGAGMAIGLFLAYQLGKLLPWLPIAALYPLGLVAGLAATWVHQGQPAYRVLLLWAQFQARRLVAGATLDVAAGQYYRRRLAPTRPFALSGTVSYSGEEGGPRRSWSGIPVARAVPRAAPGRGAPTPTPAAYQPGPPSTNGHTARGAASLLADGEERS